MLIKRKNINNLNSIKHQKKRDANWMPKNKRIKQCLLVVFFLVVFSNIISAQYLPHQTDTSFNLIQTCNNCTYCNLTRIEYPDTSSVYLNKEMTQLGTDYTYTILAGNFSSLGTYIMHGVCGNTLESQVWGIPREITETGEQFDTNQSIMLLGMFGLVALFFAIGISFGNRKWKIKTFFFMVSLLMGVIFLNSIRIIIGSSSGLQKMGQVSLILGIIVLLVMFLIFFIYYTVEVFHYFKNKRSMKWEVSDRL